MKQLKDVKILVVGDIMLDKYIVGDVNRISPEAPVPVVNVTNEYYTLGGCGNVAKNVASIGAQTACVGICGSDNGYNLIHNYLSDFEIKVGLAVDGRPTTIKERIISSNRHTQMLRIDRERTDDVSASKIISEINFITHLKNFSPDIIIVSDYNKGVITRDLMEFLEAMSIKIIIDPKPEHQHLYNKCYAITPNEQEYRMMNIWENTEFKNIIVTRGKDGISILRSEDERGVIEIPGYEAYVFNVTGCGDVVVSVLAVCVAMGMPIKRSAQIANRCAAYTATLPGTSLITKDQFEQFSGIPME